MSTYQQAITESMARAGRAAEADPRHVEAYLRCEHGTLDRLTPARFAAEVALALDCVAYGGAVGAEALARSYGL